jgi:hypothetical protein
VILSTGSPHPTYIAIMSLPRSKHNKEFHRALQSFAESEALSGEESDDGLDIIESSRKDLDLSLYIEGNSSLYMFTSQQFLTPVSPYTDADTVAECRGRQSWEEDCRI